MVWRRVVLGLFVALSIFLLVRLFVSEQGYFAYQDLKTEYEALQQRIARLEEKNLGLSREIRLLKEDKRYMESVVRKQMNFVKDNEILYIFPSESSDKPAVGASGAVQDEGKN